MDSLLRDISPNRTTLQVRRRFTAPRERVFRAWVEHEALQHWFKPGGAEVTVAHLDVRVGGHYVFESEAADGKRIITTGQYLEVTFPSKLIFTWTSDGIGDNGTLVTIEFIDQGSSTEIILTHERLANEAMIIPHRVGWETAFDHLSSFIGSPNMPLDAG